MKTVSVRGGFSDRNGIDALNTEIQITNLDERTRTAFYNVIIKFYKKAYRGMESWHSAKQDFLQYVATKIYTMKMAVDRSFSEDQIFNEIYETIFNDDYDKVLTIIEVICEYFDIYLRKVNSLHYGHSEGTIYDVFNIIFKREYVGYRFIDGYISPISDETEVNTINDSLQNRFAAVREHISKANHLLSDRNTPDYENSIKESISAVEAMCQEILGTKGKEATLGNMLKRLEENGIEIHAALKTAFQSLFGYTSDAKGIRHAGNLGGPSATFEEAKFMLVSCCAFINYLMGVRVKMKDVGLYESTKEQ